MLSIHTKWQTRSNGSILQVSDLLLQPVSVNIFYQPIAQLIHATANQTAQVVPFRQFQ
jgi:hypothetical protein